MGIGETFSLSIKNILASKMRSFLTMLGIIIGVAAVIAIAGLSNGMQGFVKDAFSSIGSNMLQVFIYDDGSGTKTVDIDQIYDIVDEHKDLLAGASPMVSVGGKVKYGTESSNYTSVGGVSEDYFDIEKLKLKEGRKLNYIDMKDRRQVCLLGAYAAENWFDGSPMGKEISINGFSFTVVGVLQRESEKTEPSERGNDNRVVIPYSAAAQINGSRLVNQFYMTTQPDADAHEAKSAIEKELREILGGPDEDTGDYFYVMSMSEMLSEMNSMISMVSIVLTIIAAISLVVGGIGIMNIMLVSVSERTREIGIRKALGAKERYIMQQFVIEAGVTSGLGGIIGIIVGFLLSAAATAIIQGALQQSMAVTPSLDSIMVAFGISVFIGILFGYLPAKKAARLNPIDALHYE